MEKHVLLNFVNLSSPFCPGLWVKKVKQLLKLNSKNPHHSCVIYKGMSVFNETYFDQTRRNNRIRWNKLENPKKSQNEPNTSFRNPLDIHFPENFVVCLIRKIMKTSEIALNRLTLIKQYVKIIFFCLFSVCNIISLSHVMNRYV